MNKQNLKKFNKTFPWFAGLSADLLFWIAIDTLFLTVVKRLTASQIVSLTSISLITCIILQIPLLNIIKRIGNTKSVKLGSLLLLISSILLTFGKRLRYYSFRKNIIRNGIYISKYDKCHIKE